MAYATENDLQNNCLIQLSIALSIVDEQCLHWVAKWESKVEEDVHTLFECLS